MSERRESMIQIDRNVAEVIARVLDDITDLDARMSCSDAGFRRHFRMLVASPVTQAAWERLRQAIEKAE